VSLYAPPGARLLRGYRRRKVAKDPLGPRAVKQILRPFAA